MLAHRSLTGWMILACSVGLSGCGGGSSPPPGSSGNKAPGVAAVVGVDASMGDVSSVPPASRPSAPASNPAGAHGSSSDDAGASLGAETAALPEGGAAMPASSGSGGPTSAHDGATSGGTVADRAAAVPAGAHAATSDSAGASLPAEGAIPSGNQPPGTETAGAIGDGINQEVGGGQPALTTQKDSIEYPIVTFFGMAKTGNYSQSEEIISAKAKSKGLAAMIRAGDLSDEMVSTYQTSFANPQFVNRKSVGTGVQFTFNTAPGETATILVAKEGATFVIKEIELSSKDR
jgi:hypothetical protein